MDKKEILKEIKLLLGNPCKGNEEAAKKIYTKFIGPVDCRIEFPRSAFIAISNICNLQCPMCGGSRPEIASPTQMPPDLFRKAVKQCKEIGINRIMLHNVNEPLLHDDILEYLIYLQDNEISVMISTNGQCLGKFIKKIKLNSRKLKTIDLRYSIEGGKKQEYEVCRYPGKYELLVKNVKLINDYCVDNNIKLSTNLNYALHKKSISHLGTFYNTFSKYINITSDSFCFLGSTWTDDNVGFNVQNTLAPLKNNLKCNVLPRHVSILPNGMVSFCCGDVTMKDTVVGNLNEEHLVGVYNSFTYKILRRHSHELHCGLFPKICENCQDADVGKSVREKLKKILDRYFVFIDNKKDSLLDLEHIDENIKNQILRITASH